MGILKWMIMVNQMLFFEISQFEFKEAMKLKIGYCYKDGKCIEEEFDFSYIKG